MLVDVITFRHLLLLAVFYCNLSFVLLKWWTRLYSLQSTHHKFQPAVYTRRRSSSTSIVITCLVLELLLSSFLSLPLFSTISSFDLPYSPLRHVDFPFDSVDILVDQLE